MQFCSESFLHCFLRLFLFFIARQFISKCVTMCIWYFNIQRKALLQTLPQHPVFERQLFCSFGFCAFHSLEVCSYYKTKCVLCIDFCLETLIFHTTGTSVSRLKYLSIKGCLFSFRNQIFKEHQIDSKSTFIYCAAQILYTYRLYILHTFVSTSAFGKNSAA